MPLSTNDTGANAALVPESFTNNTDNIEVIEMNDDVREILDANYQGRKPRLSRIDDDVKMKVLRLKAASHYAFSRLLYILDTLASAEFFMTGLLGSEPETLLLHDAVGYSQEQCLIHLQSLTVALNLFCFLKNIPTHCFMALSPGFLDRMVESCASFKELSPDRDLVLQEERSLEKEYQSFSLFRTG